MTSALLANSFINRVRDIPWHIVPVVLVALAACILVFVGLYKLLTRFCGELIEIYEEEENDYE